MYADPLTDNITWETSRHVYITHSDTIQNYTSSGPVIVAIKMKAK